MLGHGWFSLAGIQTGEFDLKDRLYTFEDRKTRKRARGSTILDLGCAEGLLSKWLLDTCGAKSVHGLDRFEPYVKMARSLMRNYDAKYEVCDFDLFDTWRELNPGFLSPKYDLVLLLRVLQKLARPAEFLKTAAALAGKSLLLQVPQRVLLDARSNYVPIDVVTLLASEFKLVVSRERGDGEFTGLFDRKQ